MQVLYKLGANREKKNYTERNLLFRYEYEIRREKKKENSLGVYSLGYMECVCLRLIIFFFVVFPCLVSFFSPQLVAKRISPDVFTIDVSSDVISRSIVFLQRFYKTGSPLLALVVEYLSLTFLFVCFCRAEFNGFDAIAI